MHRTSNYLQYTKNHLTARSPDILKSLLSVRHRHDIIHLAETSKTLREVLTSQVPRLLTRRSCNGPVEIDCRMKIVRWGPGYVGDFHYWNYYHHEC